MQELISQTTTQKCICEVLHIRCIHNLQVCTCTFCRVKAAPRHQASNYDRTTSAQLTAIVNLAQRKQRSLPANISQWSVEFASQYIKFLISLPFPREVLPRLEQFDKEHREGKDFFDATRRRAFGEYYKADCQDAENNPMLSENEKATQAMEAQND